ncbi:hypothetical protein CCHR01_09771 [Colletotrichum chrysophilum]|uniref:Uncharacterized protein n=1 Tax=Colletotrichum chrysophilum TaxID=1836956 RepID=A0AAD9EDW2_9PEZI|nr:hypothetical protein CCHR01_09771 [Colletotrichum chrysophilum]
MMQQLMSVSAGPFCWPTRAVLSTQCRAEGRQKSTTRHMATWPSTSTTADAVISLQLPYVDVSHLQLALQKDLALAREQNRRLHWQAPG